MPQTPLLRFANNGVDVTHRVHAADRRIALDRIGHGYIGGICVTKSLRRRSLFTTLTSACQNKPFRRSIDRRPVRDRGTEPSEPSDRYCSKLIVNHPLSITQTGVEVTEPTIENRYETSATTVSKHELVCRPESSRMQARSPISSRCAWFSCRIHPNDRSDTQYRATP